MLPINTSISASLDVPEYEKTIWWSLEKDLRKFVIAIEDDGHGCGDADML